MIWSKVLSLSPIHGSTAGGHVPRKTAKHGLCKENKHVLKHNLSIRIWANILDYGNVPRSLYGCEIWGPLSPKEQDTWDTWDTWRHFTLN